MDMDEDPPHLVEPRPAAVRGEEKRRASADEPELRTSRAANQSGSTSVGNQSDAKKQQAKAAQADPGPEYQQTLPPIAQEVASRNADETIVACYEPLLVV